MLIKNFKLLLSFETETVCSEIYHVYQHVVHLEFLWPKDTLSKNCWKWPSGSGGEINKIPKETIALLNNSYTLFFWKNSNSLPSRMVSLWKPGSVPFACCTMQLYWSKFLTPHLNFSIIWKLYYNFLSMDLNFACILKCRTVHAQINLIQFLINQL